MTPKGSILETSAFVFLTSCHFKITARKGCASLAAREKEVRIKKASSSLSPHTVPT
ncbi:hypothetical protein CHS0354_033952, partial [Potamilus streckersoni]